MRSVLAVLVFGGAIIWLLFMIGGMKVGIMDSVVFSKYQSPDTIFSPWARSDGTITGDFLRRVETRTLGRGHQTAGR